jgi:protein-S-isoprenylcysteine O-methyltransferase Ste14
MKASAPISNPGVPFPPPILFVGGFGLGWLLDHAVRNLGLLAPNTRIMEPVGLGLAVLGFCLMAWAIITFQRKRTAIYPNQPASSLVAQGPYRFTRNPMYAGLAIAYVGGSLLIGSIWPIVVLPLVLLLLIRLVIRREEAYLADRFGESYAEYRRKVRRWL